MAASQTLHCQTKDFLMVFLESLLIQKSSQWTCLPQNACALYQGQVILTS